MPNLQPVYRSGFRKGIPGQIANSELRNPISRTVETAAGIAFGQPAFRGSGDHGVVAGTTFAATGAAVALGTNTGNGTFGTITVSAGASAGGYAIEFDDATHYVVNAPDGSLIGHGTTGSPFSAGGLAFTITAGGTAFVPGDSFTLTVTYTANLAFLGLTVLDPGVITNATLPDAYQQYQTATIMAEGHMYVTAGASVNDGDQAYWNPATARFTNVSSHIRLIGVRFDTTGVDGDVVEVSIRNRSA
jgi:hypothetical protein